MNYAKTSAFPPRTVAASPNMSARWLFIPPNPPPLTRAGRPARSGGHEAAARPQACGTLQEDLLEDLQLRGWRSRRSLRRHFAAVSNSFSFSKVMDYCKQT